MVWPDPFVKQWVKFAIFFFFDFAIFCLIYTVLFKKPAITLPESFMRENSKVP